MTEISIRAAIGQDQEPVWDMLRPVFREGRTYAIDANISREDALGYWFSERTYVAEDDVPLGTYYIQKNRPGGGAHYCNCGFVTAPAAQGRGVARQMLAHALVEAKAFGFSGMVFNFVAASNTRAVTTWDLFGFEEVGRVPGAFFNGETFTDALVMFRKL